MGEAHNLPHGGLRGFRRPHILGCYVTRCALHKTLKLIAWCKLTFNERVVVHRVADEPDRAPASVALHGPVQSLYSNPQPTQSLYSNHQPIQSLYNNPQPIQSLYSNPQPIQSLYSNPQPIQSLYRAHNLNSDID